jgi:hypothetical protein
MHGSAPIRERPPNSIETAPKVSQSQNCTPIDSQPSQQANPGPAPGLSKQKQYSPLVAGSGSSHITAPDQLQHREARVAGRGVTGGGSDVVLDLGRPAGSGFEIGGGRCASSDCRPAGCEYTIEKMVVTAIRAAMTDSTTAIRSWRCPRILICSKTIACWSAGNILETSTRKNSAVAVMASKRSAAGALLMTLARCLSHALYAIRTAAMANAAKLKTDPTYWMAPHASMQSPQERLMRSVYHVRNSGKVGPPRPHTLAIKDKAQRSPAPRGQVLPRAPRPSYWALKVSSARSLHSWCSI